MTEEEAEGWVIERFGIKGRDKLALLANLVLAESAHQNLIAPSTISTIWARHLVDSAQLIPLAEAQSGTWLDIGSGAGFPGLVVAALTALEVALVEPRRRRATFLADAAEAMGVGKRVIVHPCSVERLTIPASVISARAVASLESLFEIAVACSTLDTVWALPKGRSAAQEVESARHSWHGVFHVEQSVTDTHSHIVLASKVSRR